MCGPLKGALLGSGSGWNRLPICSAVLDKGGKWAGGGGGGGGEQTVFISINEIFVCDLMCC